MSGKRPNAVSGRGRMPSAPVPGKTPQVDMSNWREQLLARRVKFDDVQKQIFLQHYTETGLMMHSAELAETTDWTVRRHMEIDPDFAEAVDQARQSYRDHIKTKVYELAVEGVQEPIIGGEFKDEIVAYKTVYFPNLLAMEAKRVEPAYRENAGAVQVQVNTGVVVLPPAPSSPEEFERQVLAAHLDPPSEVKWEAERALEVEAELLETKDKKPALPQPDPEAP